VVVTLLGQADGQQQQHEQQAKQQQQQKQEHPPLEVRFHFYTETGLVGAYSGGSDAPNGDGGGGGVLGSLFPGDDGSGEVGGTGGCCCFMARAARTGRRAGRGGAM
jgi:hypothetical protein